MESMGINFGLFFLQLVAIILIFGLPIISLFDLRKNKLSGTTLGIWVLIICAIPIIGPLAYWIVKPSVESK